MEFTSQKDLYSGILHDQVVKVIFNTKNYRSFTLLSINSYFLSQKAFQYLHERSFNTLPH